MTILLLYTDDGVFRMLPGRGRAGEFALLPVLPVPDGAAASNAEAIAALQQLAAGEAQVVDCQRFLAAASRLDAAALVQARGGRRTCPIPFCCKGQFFVHSMPRHCADRLVHHIGWLCTCAV